MSDMIDRMQKKIYYFYKKRKKEIGILLILISGGFLLLSIFSFIDKDKEEVKPDTESKISETMIFDSMSETESEENGTEDIIISIPESTEATDVFSTELDADYIINPDFKIEGLGNDVQALINSDLDSLSQKMQEDLYYNGFYGYTEAVSTGYTEVNDNDNTVIINFNVKANKEVILDAIYYRDDKSWQIKVW